MNDVEELTTLVRLRAGKGWVKTYLDSGMQPLWPACHPQLRSAGEYEERKLIRAAIRRVRAQEIKGRCLPSVDSPLPCISYLTSLPDTCLALSFQLPPWLGDCAVDFPVVAPERTAGGRQHTHWTLVR